MGVFENFDLNESDQSKALHMTHFIREIEYNAIDRIKLKSKVKWKLYRKKMLNKSAQ